MTGTVLGALATAGALGVTHALEPDHVAGISALSGRFEAARRSALVGACFSLGHVALVVVWLGVAALLFGVTTFPPILNAIGTAVVAVVLGVVGALLAVGGYRATARDHRRRHDHESAAGPHVHLPLQAGAENHDHTTPAYLRTGLVGALFTLSPPLSMIAFLGAILPMLGRSTAFLAVLVYAIGITATMAVLGAGVGTLFGLTRGHERATGLVRLATGLLVVALAVRIGLQVVPV